MELAFTQAMKKHDTIGMSLVAMSNCGAYSIRFNTVTIRNIA
jgi:phosphoribosylaminoimidazole (AIR) synthetase